MISYIFELSICWICFFLLYKVLFAKETFFQLNRFYLLFSLVLSLCIPFFEVPILTQTETTASGFVMQPITVTVQSLEYTLETVVVTPVTNTISFSTVLLCIYFLGVLLFFSKFMYGLAQIFLLYKNGVVDKTSEGYYLVKTKSNHLPFSFFKCLFWSDAISFTQEEEMDILKHEKAHMDQWHSVDVLIVELISIVLWISPIIFLYKNAIKSVHEYLADATVLEHTPIKKYGHLLLRQTQSGQQLALANNFIQSQLKKRITMMTRNKSKSHSIIKYTLAIPLIMLMTILFSTQDLMAQFNTENFKEELSSLMKGHENQSSDEQLQTYVKAYEIITKTKKEYPSEAAAIESVVEEVLPPAIEWGVGNFTEEATTIYKVVEEMPRFAGCDDVKKDPKECSNSELLKFVYTNIKYPAAARDKGIEGIVVIRFVVSEKGEVSNPEVIRSIGGGCDEAALNVVNKMPNWIPGKQSGKNVSVYYHMPVKFKLDNGTTQVSAESLMPEGMDKKALIVINDVPSTSDEQHYFTKEKIETVTVLSSEKAITKYGDKGRNGALLIYLNNSTNEEKAINPTSAKYKIVTKVDANGNEYTEAEKIHTGEDHIFKVVDQMPRFPGCEDSEESREEKQQCANQEMLKFIYTNIKYPKEAAKNNIQGTAVVRFIVDENGDILEPKVVRSISPDIDDEVLRVVGLMNGLPEKWTPGIQAGKNVKVYFNLPVKFKLADDPKPVTENISESPAIKLELSEVKVFPNPADDQLNISFKADAKPISVSLSDALGRVIFSKQVNDFDGNYNDQIDLSKVPAGALILNVTQEDKIWVRTVVRK